MDTNMARQLNSVINLSHAFVYFVPEAAEEYASLGLEGQDAYFAGRAAPLGAVPAEVVVATFFNFCPDLVHRAIPSAWDVAPPEDWVESRWRIVGRVYDRVDVGLSPEEMEEATGLATQVCDRVSYAGKPLAAANRAIDLPADLRQHLWLLITIIREWRGDAHIGVLNTEALTPIEALVLYGATGQFPPELLKATRGWPDEQWDATVANLADRGLVTADGAFTTDGEAYRESIEQRTDEASMPLWNSLGADGTERLFDLLRPMRRALLAAEVYPFARR